MAKWIVENWFLIVALAAGVGSIGVAIYKFAGLPTSKQVEKIKEWLLYEVTIAEKKLGGGTGKLKLRLVYDAFISKFPVAAQIVSFGRFSEWVDDALDEMKKMLKSNKGVQEFVAGEMAAEEQGD